MKRITEIPSVEGKRVLVRLDLNVPIEEGRIQDPFRIDRAMNTVEYLLDKKAKVVVISHMSDSKGTLLPVYEYLKTKVPITFVPDLLSDDAHALAGSMAEGSVLLMENIRRSPLEEANDDAFSKHIASFGDFYVNDAFPVSHRAHASIVGVPKYLPSYAGFQFLLELDGLTPALSPVSPSLAIVGGAKLVTKVKLIETLLSKYDKVFVGGAIVNDFYKAKGYEVGKSLVSGADHAKSLLLNPKIILPDELIVVNELGSRETISTEVGADDVIIDISPTAIEKLKEEIGKANTILWNGPMGNFEKGFRSGTDELAKLIGDSGARSMVGGGDTLSSIQSLNLMDKFGFVSTAGGAMLDFLASGTLPGIEALEGR